MSFSPAVDAYALYALSSCYYPAMFCHDSTQFPYILGCFGSGYKYVLHVQKNQEIPIEYVGRYLIINKTHLPKNMFLLIV